MQETYREYGRLQVCAWHIERLEAELETLHANGAGGSTIKEATDRLAQMKERLKEHHAEALRCLQREDELRAKLGFPPLEQRILSSAHESLRKYADIFQEQDAETAIL